MLHFARLGEPFPKSLLGYTSPVFQLDSRTQPGKLSLRMTDIPQDYLDATAAHLCPMDFISHNLIPPALRRGQVTTITLTPTDVNWMASDLTHAIVKKGCRDSVAIDLSERLEYVDRSRDDRLESWYG